MAVTIKDIARLADCSYATVSRALNDKPGISQQTKRKIVAIAKDIGYQPNAIARGLVTQKTHSIGLVIPDIVNPFYPEIARGVEDEANSHGFAVFLCNANFDLTKEKKYIKALIEKRVDGIIIKPSFDIIEKYPDGLTHLDEVNVPLVIFSGHSSSGKHSYVEIDNISGGFLATQHLLDAGYRRVAFIGGHVDSFSNLDRIKGYRSALEKNGTQVNEQLILNMDFNSESGYQMMKQLLEFRDPPDAVFACNDVIALGALEYLKQKKIDVPEQFGVIGFDNILFAGYPQIQLTTIAQPKYRMGKYAVEILLNEINDLVPPGAQNRILEPELIVRKTTRNVSFPFKSTGY